MSRTILDVKPKKLVKQLGFSPSKGKFGEGLDPDIDPVPQDEETDNGEEPSAPPEQRGKEMHRRGAEGNEDDDAPAAPGRDSDPEEAREGEVPHPPPSSSGELPNPDDEDDEEGAPGEPADSEPSPGEELPDEEMDYDTPVDVDDDVDGYDGDDDEDDWGEDGEDTNDEDEDADDAELADKYTVPMDESGNKEYPDPIPPKRPSVEAAGNDTLKVWSDRRQPNKKKKV